MTFYEADVVPSENCDCGPNQLWTADPHVCVCGMFSF